MKTDVLKQQLTAQFGGEFETLISMIVDRTIENVNPWISVDEKDPDCELQDEGIKYSKYLEIKVKGYEHPFIGLYVLAGDDQFFDFIHRSIDEGIKQEDITHYRFVL